MSVHNPLLTVQERAAVVRPPGVQGIFASTGPRYAGSTFGRDSIEFAEDVVEFDEVIPREVLLRTAALQGLTINPVTEERPGQIHHLHRYWKDMLDEDTRKLYLADSERWGGDEKEMIYYGTVDATPLFGRLACRYVQLYGDSILQVPVTGRDGQERRFEDHVRMAGEWLLDKLNTSAIGLVEFQHTNPKGEKIQTWKDSLSAYVHIDGTPISVSRPIAALEVQGYAYDALKGLAELMPGLVPPKLIQELGHRVVQYFWREKEQLFVQAIDRDENGNVRPVLTPTSNSGLLLDSSLLEDMPDTDHMVDATIQMLLGPDFMTQYGIRCRSLKYAHLIDYPDYHGSYTTWYKEWNDFIRGLERFGHQNEAIRQAQNLITAVQSQDEYFEYSFVDDVGRAVPVFIDDSKSVRLDVEPGSKFADPRCHIPEPGQAWTISAFLRSLRLVQHDAQ